MPLPTFCGIKLNHMIYLPRLFVDLLSIARPLKKNTTRGTALSYFMETMGCQMNVADSERMEGQMADLG